MLITSYVHKYDKYTAITYECKLTQVKLIYTWKTKNIVRLDRLNARLIANIATSVSNTKSSPYNVLCYGDIKFQKKK